MINDPIFFDLAEMLLECAASGLQNDTTLGVPAYRAVVIGEASHDNCCEGQLTVAYTRQFPSSQFPEEDFFTTTCGPPYTVLEYDIEHIICSPTINGLGRFPAAQAITENAKEVLIAARAIWAAVACCLQANLRDFNSVMRAQEAITPEGGCVGSRLTVWIGLTTGCGCE